MFEIKIPGRNEFNIKNIVFDYNGTLATDGTMDEATANGILKLKEFANVYVVTADTHGNVREQCKDLGITVKTFPTGKADIEKKKIVEELGAIETICIGNGYNDIEMFKIAAISIAIIHNEGCSGKLIGVSDIVVTSIEDAINMILNPKRIIATLRG